MKTRSFLFCFFVLGFFFLAAGLTAAQANGSALVVDQFQEEAPYGYWFEKNVVRWQEFKPVQTSLAQVDLYIHKSGFPGNLLVAIKDGKRVLWESVVSSRNVPANGWVSIPVEPEISLQPNRSYVIQVWADADSPDVQNRYFWEGLRDSDYIRGISSVEEASPGYDFAFRTWADTNKHGKVCYIHDENTAAAQHFKALLDANGFTTSLLDVRTLGGTDFSSFDLIITGDDTGYHYDYDNPDAVRELADSGKPILGLGYGGAALFQEMELFINWGNGAVGSGQNIYVPTTGHDIFTSFFDIGIPKTGILGLYSESSPAVEEYVGSLPTQVDLIGRMEGSESYYPLTRENEYLLWGFRNSPDTMTTTGKKLLINTVAYLAAFTPPPLFLSLSVEDALEGVVVNKVTGDIGEGPTNYTRLEVVAKLFSLSSSATNNISVDLTVANNVFGSPVRTSVRPTSGADSTTVSYQTISSGRYRVTADLSPVLFWGVPVFYRTQIVWRFLIPEDTPPQDISLAAEILQPAFDSTAGGKVRILAPEAVSSLIVTNRELLYDNLAEGEVNNLLARLFKEAQGHPASHSPTGVIYYADRYDSRLLNWDNTNVDYASEAAANVAANALDDLIEDWHDDATQFMSVNLPFIGQFTFPVASPRYLLLVGDDDILPFYRYNDPYNDEKTWNVNSATNPAILATDHDYFFTDNPYADLGGGTDWQTGDIELWNGRLLGETAADMLQLLEEAVNWDNGRTGGIVMASVDGWELGLEPDDGRAGEIADLHDVPGLFIGRGFTVRNDNTPAGEVQTIDVMSPWEGGSVSWNNNFRNAANNAGGMDLFFIGGHDGYDHAVIPGDDFDPGDTPTVYTRFDNDHPFAMIVGCHGGTPVPDIDLDGGIDNCMVYDLIHEGARSYIGATGFSYGSPNNLHKCTWGERLIQRYFDNLLMPGGSNSMTIGKALAEAKQDYTFGFGSKDALDRKTVTEFQLYGVPWSFLFYPDAAAAEGLVESKSDAAAAKGYTVAALDIQAQETAVYKRTIDITLPEYRIDVEEQNSIKYALFSIKGGEVAVSPDQPILPFIKGFSMPLPPGAEILDVQLVKSNFRNIGDYNIPIAKVMPWSEGGLNYTTETDITVPVPDEADLVQYQVSGGEALFTVFPIRHNPTTDETWFSDYFTLEITYEAPIEVMISQYSLDREQYAPGDPVRTTTRVSNIGSEEVQLTVALAFVDSAGQGVGHTVSRFYSVPAGQTLTVPLSWEGEELDDGSYTAQVTLLYGGKLPVGGESVPFSVVSGSLKIEGPEELPAGGNGIFKVTFANYKSYTVSGSLKVNIQNTAGGRIYELPARKFVVNGEDEIMLDFDWQVPDTASGDFTATAWVLNQGIGPASTALNVQLDVCEGDVDHDLDTDAGDLEIMASEFGKAGCPGGCMGDLDKDSDQDGKDMAKFAEDMGRSNCPGI